MPKLDQNNSNLTDTRTRNKRGGLVDTITPPAAPYQITISGNYAYVADYGYGLRIINISDPANLVLVGSYFTNDPQNFAVAVSGNYAYIGSASTGNIYSINISNPANPTLTNTFNFGTKCTEFIVKGNYLYSSGIQNSGLLIVNISNPASLTVAARYPLTGETQSVAVVGNYAYLANEQTGLYILDITNPADPRLRGNINILRAHGVVVKGTYAYVVNPYTGLQIVDISNPNSPSIVAGYGATLSRNEAYKVTVIGNYAFVNNGIIVDISNPASPGFAGNAGLGGDIPYVEGYAIFAMGNYVYGSKQSFRALKVLPAPQLVSNQLTISEGQTRTLTTTNLNASDADDGNSIIYTVSNVAGGRFELSSNPGTAITSFTKQQIINGVVRFVHNSGEVAPSYNVKVSDGLINTRAVAATITYTPLNDAPVLSSSNTGAISFTENGAAVIVNSNLTISDVDNINLVSATIAVVGYVAGEDVLTLPTNPQNGITASFNTNTGVLTLTGSSTIANYQAALRTVTYKNTSENPSTAARSINIRVNDGNAASNILSRNLAIVATNDAPVLSSSNTGAINFTENGTAIAVNPNLMISDVDNVNLNSAIVTLVGYVTGEDILTLPTNPQNGITASFNTTTGVLNLTGSSTVANYQTALRSVTYQNTSVNPATTARSITIQVNDNSASSNALSRNLTIVAANNLPVLSSSSTDVISFTENSVAIAAIPDLTITDPDSINLANATVTVIGYVAGEDVLALPTNPQNGITAIFNTTTGVLNLAGNSTIANYQTALRTVTYQNLNNTVIANRGIEFLVNDGEGDSNSITRDINLVPLNNLLSGNSNLLMCFNQESEKLICPQLSILGGNALTLESATVIITNAASEDVLTFDDLGHGISGNYDNSTGTLILTGPTSAENFAETLRTIKYSNNINNLTASNRSYNVTVNFEGQPSNTLASQLDLITVNDAPVVINPVEDFNVTVNEPFSIVLNNNTFTRPISELSLSVTENEGTLTSLSFDANTRTLNGSLSTAGENYFSFFASDRCDQTAVSNFTVNAIAAPVASPTAAPVAVPVASPTATPLTDSNIAPTSPVQDNTGPIAGGIVGGIAGLVILGGAIFGGLWAWKKKQSKKPADTVAMPAVVNRENLAANSASSSTSRYTP